jgi:hypothetical protein
LLLMLWKPLYSSCHNSLFTHFQLQCVHSDALFILCCFVSDTSNRIIFHL